MFIYRLALPPIPPELALDIESEEAFRNKPWPVTVGQTTRPSGHYRSQRAGPELTAWINANLTDTYLALGLSTMWGEQHNAPHTDTTRDWTLIWPTELGGDRVRTVFYREQNQELQRPRDCHPDYPTLEKLAEYQLELHNWYLIDSRIVHSVEGIESARTSIQLGFDRDNQWIKEQINTVCGQEINCVRS